MVPAKPLSKLFILEGHSVTVQIDVAVTVLAGNLSRRNERAVYRCGSVGKRNSPNSVYCAVKNSNKEEIVVYAAYAVFCLVLGSA